MLASHRGTLLSGQGMQHNVMCAITGSLVGIPVLYRHSTPTELLRLECIFWNSQKYWPPQISAGERPGVAICHTWPLDSERRSGNGSGGRTLPMRAAGSAQKYGLRQNKKDEVNWFAQGFSTKAQVPKAPQSNSTGRRYIHTWWRKCANS